MTALDLARGLVRPIVTIALVGAVIGVVYLGLTGIATMDDAKEAAAILGTPTGLVVGFWFNGRAKNGGVAPTPLTVVEPDVQDEAA